MEVLEDMESLKKLSLFMDHVSKKSSKTGEKWIRLKEDIREVCAGKGIQIVLFDVDANTVRDELIWVD